MLCKYGKRELQLTDNQLTAISRSCLGRIRTLTKGARNLRATITPQGNVRCDAEALFRFCDAKVVFFFILTKFFRHFFHGCNQQIVHGVMKGLMKKPSVGMEGFL